MNAAHQAVRAFEFAAVLALRFEGSIHTLAVLQPREGVSGRDPKAQFEAGMAHFQPKFERLRLQGTGARESLFQMRYEPGAA